MTGSMKDIRDTPEIYEKQSKLITLKQTRNRHSKQNLIRSLQHIIHLIRRLLYCLQTSESEASEGTHHYFRLCKKYIRSSK